MKALGLLTFQEFMGIAAFLDSKIKYLVHRETGNVLLLWYHCHCDERYCIEWSVNLSFPVWSSATKSASESDVL